MKQFMAVALASLLLGAMPACKTQTFPTVIPIDKRAEGTLVRELEPDWVVMLVQTIAIKAEGRETLESLWQHVNEAAFSGGSKELWIENGLRIGLADNEFVERTRNALEELSGTTKQSYCLQKPRGFPFVISVPWQQEDTEVLIFTEEGRAKARKRYLQIHLLGDVIEGGALHITLTPFVSAQEQGSTVELKGLAGEVLCRSFYPIVLGASSYDETRCGSAFMFSNEDGSTGEFIIIMYPVFVVERT